MRLIDARLTDHFSLLEFRCGGRRCACRGHGVLVDQELVTALEEMRCLTAAPLAITSAFRCEDHNARIGGHPQSYHRVGQAADLTSTIVRADLRTWGEKFGQVLVGRLGSGRGNVIVYPNRGFVHVDTGQRVAVELVRFDGGPVKDRGW